jgi:hypothetical protein
MLTVNLDLTFSMVWDIAFANILAAGLLMLLSRQVGKVAFLPAHSVIPGVMVVLLMGAWIATSSMGDWWTCLAMGVLGYAMKQGGWPRPPLILAFVLGTMIENNYQLTMQVYDGLSWMYQRPIVVCIEIAIAVTLVLAARGFTRPKSKQLKDIKDTDTAESLMSLGIAAALTLLFVWAYATAQAFDDAQAARFPLTILTVAIPLLLFLLLQDGRNCSRGISTCGGIGAALTSASRTWELRPSLRFIAFVFAILVMTYAVGQLVALPLFVAIYLRSWGKFSWLASLTYAAVSGVVIWGLYVRILNMHLYSSLLFG